jgi:hypothetical protein
MDIKMRNKFSHYSKLNHIMKYKKYFIDLRKYNLSITGYYGKVNGASGVNLLNKQANPSSENQILFETSTT